MTVCTERDSSPPPDGVAVSRLRRLAQKGAFGRGVCSQSRPLASCSGSGTGGAGAARQTASCRRRPCCRAASTTSRSRAGPSAAAAGRRTGRGRSPSCRGAARARRRSSRGSRASPRGSRDLGLTRGQLTAEVLEPAGLVLEVGRRLLLGLLAAHLRLAPVELGLTGCELALLGRDLRALRAHGRDDLAAAGALLGQSLQIGGEPVGLGLQLRLAGLDELALALGDALVALRQLGLLVLEHLLARPEHGLAGVDAGRALGDRAL